MKPARELLLYSIPRAARNEPGDYGGGAHRPQAFTSR